MKNNAQKCLDLLLEEILGHKSNSNMPNEIATQRAIQRYRNLYRDANQGRQFYCKEITYRSPIQLTKPAVELLRACR